MLVFLLILIMICIFLFATIKIQFQIYNSKYNIVIRLKFLNILTFFKIKLKSKDINKKLKKIQVIKQKIGKEQTKEGIQIIKKLKIAIEYIDLRLIIGTEFITFTTCIITIISIIFPIILSTLKLNKSKDNYKYYFESKYNQNKFNLTLDCIISIKMVHIINVIIQLLLKKGGKKNDRASNTRVDDNCYE